MPRATRASHWRINRFTLRPWRHMQRVTDLPQTFSRAAGRPRRWGAALHPHVQKHLQRASWCPKWCSEWPLLYGLLSAYTSEP